MDIQCIRTFLQEMLVKAEDDTVAIQSYSTFLMCLHDMEERELSVIFRSAAQHFEYGGNCANLFFMGKRDIPGSWVDMCNVAEVSSFVAVLQFENAMPKANFTRYLHRWLKKQCIPDQMIDKVVRHSRVFTTRECEAMGLRFESSVDVDEGILGDFKRLRDITQPENAEESRELMHLLGKCNEWMEENDLPDEIFDLPSDELFDAVVRYNSSSGASAAMLTDGLVTIDRNAVQICDASPEVNIETPALADEPDDPVDSCDELERELVANQTVVQTNSAQLLQLQRRVHEPAGHLLFKRSAELPALVAHRPKHRMSTDDVTEVLVERFHRKHGTAEPSGFKDAMLQIAGCYREMVDEGRLTQKDRVTVILPLLAAAYKKLFDRKAASVSTELKDEISRIVLRSKCKNCGNSFVPSDQFLYSSDADGNEVVVGNKAYNTRDFCGAQCEERWQCFRCKCDRPLQPGKLGWLDAKCSRCGVGRPTMGFTEMDNILSGLDRHDHVKRFLPF